ncbi:MAG: META domain-containing protein [Pseudomonadota bacterium]
MRKTHNVRRALFRIDGRLASVACHVTFIDMQWILVLITFAMEHWPRDETISGYADRGAVYRLIEIGGQPAPADATIRFTEKGRIDGTGPCNSYAAAQTAPYPWIEVGAMASTRKACPDLAFETEFFEALQAVTLAEVSGPIVILSDPPNLELVFELVDAEEP